MEITSLFRADGKITENFNTEVLILLPKCCYQRLGNL